MCSKSVKVILHALADSSVSYTPSSVRGRAAATLSVTEAVPSDCNWKQTTRRRISHPGWRNDSTSLVYISSPACLCICLSIFCCFPCHLSVSPSLAFASLHSTLGGQTKLRGVSRRASLSLLIKTSHPNKCSWVSHPLISPYEKSPPGPDVCLSEDKYLSGSFLCKGICSLCRFVGLAGVRKTWGSCCVRFPLSGRSE